MPPKKTVTKGHIAMKRHGHIAAGTWFVAMILSLIVVLFAFTAPAEPHVPGRVRGGYHGDTKIGLIGDGGPPPSRIPIRAAPAIRTWD
jgi:hypothetical protein